MSDATTVLLVDDQELLRLGLRMIVESTDDLAVVGEAGTGERPSSPSRRCDPTSSLMDVRMPGSTASRRRVTPRPRAPREPIIILTTFDLDEYAFAGLRAGASGFLLKDAPPAELSPASGRSPPATRSSRRDHPGAARRCRPRLPMRGRARGAVGLLGGRSPSASTTFSSPSAGADEHRDRRRLVLRESTVKTHVGRVLAEARAARPGPGRHPRLRARRGLSDPGRQVERDGSDHFCSFSRGSPHRHPARWADARLQAPPGRRRESARRLELVLVPLLVVSGPVRPASTGRQLRRRLARPRPHRR